MARVVVLFQDFLGSREVREFISGALAGAMTKAILAPLETIRFTLYESLNNFTQIISKAYKLLVQKGIISSSFYAYSLRMISYPTTF